MGTNSVIFLEDVRRFILFKSTDVSGTENLLNKRNIFFVLGSKDPTKSHRLRTGIQRSNKQVTFFSYWDPKIQQNHHCLSTGTQIFDKQVIVLELGSEYPTNISLTLLGPKDPTKTTVIALRSEDPTNM